MRLIKLVRDLIPEVVPNAVVVYRKLDKRQHRNYLRNKLIEEALEYKDDPNVEELSDVLECVLALAEVDLCISPDLVESMAARKRAARGSLKGGVGMYIAETDEPVVVGQTAEHVIAWLEHELSQYDHPLDTGRSTIEKLLKNYKEREGLNTP